MNNKSGFTLIEMCISLVVIAVIVSAVAPAITSSAQKTKKKQLAIENFKSGSDCENFSTTAGTYQGKSYAGMHGCVLCTTDVCIKCELDTIPGFKINHKTCNYEADSSTEPSTPTNPTTPDGDSGSSSGGNSSGGNKIPIETGGGIGSETIPRPGDVQLPVVKPETEVM